MLGLEFGPVVGLYVSLVDRPTGQFLLMGRATGCEFLG